VRWECKRGWSPPPNWLLVSRRFQVGCVQDLELTFVANLGRRVLVMIDDTRPNAVSTMSPPSASSMSSPPRRRIMEIASAEHLSITVGALDPDRGPGRSGQRRDRALMTARHVPGSPSTAARSARSTPRGHRAAHSEDVNSTSRSCRGQIKGSRCALFMVYPPAISIEATPSTPAAIYRSSARTNLPSRCSNARQHYDVGSL